MSFDSGYRGSIGSNGSVQTAYTDHPAIGIPGMIAFASDTRKIDTILIGEANGIACGKGVKFTNIVQADTDFQTPPKAAYLPSGVEVLADFGGILCFNEAVQSDENGNPGWANGREGRVLLPYAAGGRIYIKAREAIAVGDSVNWVIGAPADESYELGEFAPSALGGGVAGTSIVLPTNVARWVRGAAADGDVALLELLGTFSAPIVT